MPKFIQHEDCHFLFLECTGCRIVMPLTKHCTTQAIEDAKSEHVCELAKPMLIRPLAA